MLLTIESQFCMGHAVLLSILHRPCSIEFQLYMGVWYALYHHGACMLPWRVYSPWGVTHRVGELLARTAFVHHMRIKGIMH